MPEGDVLRLTAERLDQALRDVPLVRAELRWPGVGGTELTGRTVTGCVSYGKHLLTRFDDGRTLHTHLRMEGSWRVVPTDDRAAAARHPQVRAVLSTARWTCVGWRLGMLDLLRTHDEPRLLAHLGPDVLGSGFGTDGLVTALDHWHAQADRPVCDVLLDQSVVAGLGTIWMAESLFARRLHPWAPADSLDDEEVQALLVAARRLMGRSVDVGRRHGLGEVPRSVHGRLGQPCRRCRTPIAVGQANEPPYERPVFWCPTCQAVSRPA